MSSEIDELIAYRYPGIVLESPVQGWAYLEEFERGVLEFEQLAEPNSKDMRWVGVCHFQLFDDMKALEAFYLAIALGEEAARVNLAHLLRFIERADEASDELAKASTLDLNTYDRVLYYRVLSLHEENNGNLHKALRFSEEAWRMLQGTPEFQILASSILSQLGVLHSRIGRSQRALWYMERGLKDTSGFAREKALLQRIQLLINLGRFQEARTELDTIQVSETLLALKVLLEGELSWSTNNIPDAISLYLSALRPAVERQLVFEEFICRLALVAIFGIQGDYPSSSEHLALAQPLISDKSDRLNYRFREVLLNHWKKEYTSEHAIAELQTIAHEFKAMGLLQEHGWVRLHIAELFRLIGSNVWRGELDALQILSVTLQNTSFLAREWTLVPGLKTEARITHPKIAGNTLAILEVQTLGQEGLVFDGKRVNIPMRRGVEVLAYFLEHRTVDLKRLIADIFPEVKYRSAKSYFHQFRYQLQDNIPGIEIEYDSGARLYRLKTELDIVWDVAELRAGRKNGPGGLFLPSSGNEWVEHIQHEIDAISDANSEAIAS